MKWVSHEIVTGMAVYTWTGSLVSTACAMAGAVLPDWIEGKGGGVRLPWRGLLAHHIAEDALCGKVPLFHPAKKVGVRLFRVGSFAEYVFAIVVVIVCYVVGRLFLW